jgi:hypothetical protein
MSTGILQAVGAHRGSDDTEFEARVKHFSDHTGDLQRVKEAMEIWMDAFDSFCTASDVLGQAFEQYYSAPSQHWHYAPSPAAAGGAGAASVGGEDESDGSNLGSHSVGPSQQKADSTDSSATMGNPADKHAHNSLREVAISFRQMTSDLRSAVCPAVRNLFSRRCIKPTTHILSLVPPVHESIQTRKKLLLDFDSYKAKTVSDVTAGKDTSKNAFRLDEAAVSLTAIQAKIYEAFDEFEDARPTMLGHEFAASISCCFHFSSVAAALYGKLLPLLPQTASTLCLLNLSHQHVESMDSSQNIQLIKNSAVLATRATVVPRPSESSANTFIVTKPLYTRSIVAGGSEGGYGTLGLPTPLPQETSLNETIAGAPTQVHHHHQIHQPPQHYHTDAAAISRSDVKSSVVEEKIVRPTSHEGLSRLPDHPSEFAQVVPVVPPAKPVKPAKPPRSGSFTKPDTSRGESAQQAIGPPSIDIRDTEPKSVTDEALKSQQESSTAPASFNDVCNVQNAADASTSSSI